MHKVSSELSERVHACTEDYYQVAEKALNRRFVRPYITFDQKGKIAGSARLQQNQIRLNPVLLSDNTEDFELQVIPHEISHLLVFQLFGRVKPHGQEWRHIMLHVFARKPLVRHTMDVSKVSGKEFDYKCACGPIKLSIRRHNNIERNQRVYLCKTCGAKLEPLAGKGTI